MIPPAAFYLALTAAVSGVIVAWAAIRETRHNARHLNAMKNWAAAQEIFITCIEDELYQTRRVLGTSPGEKTYETAARRLAAKELT